MERNFQSGMADKTPYNWPELAGRLAVGISVERLNPTATEELRNRLLKPGRVAIACSGGADSLCLLLLLWAHFGEFRKNFLVLHFDHRIRGAESAEDARFVESVSKSLGAECITGEWKDSRPNADEETARIARMAFLHARAKVICFGHNRTDVAETILMRLGRGSSLDGLAGPRPVQRFGNDPELVHIRPLLDFSSVEIRKKLTECGIPWREDATNAADAYARNRIRHDVLPLLDEALGRDWSAGAACSRARIEEADGMVESFASQFVGASGVSLALSLLRTQPVAVIRRVVELWLAKNALRGGVGRKSVDDLVDCVLHRSEKGTGCRGPGFGVANNELRVLPKSHFVRDGIDGSYRLVAGGELIFPWGASLRAEALHFRAGEAASLILEMRKAGNNRIACLSIPCDSVLEIRRRRAGDAYQPLGLRGKTKLKKALIDRKIPFEEREKLPIVLVENRIAWCPMMPPAENVKLTESTLEAVRLIYFFQTDL